MDIDFLTNPWVISTIVISVMVGNLAALKYVSKIRFKQMEKKPQDKQQTSDKPKDENKQNP